MVIEQEVYKQKVHKRIIPKYRFIDGEIHVFEKYAYKDCGPSLYKKANKYLSDDVKCFTKHAGASYIMLSLEAIKVLHRIQTGYFGNFYFGKFLPQLATYKEEMEYLQNLYDNNCIYDSEV